MITNEVIYDLVKITGGICNRRTPRTMKMEIICDLFNMDKWQVLDFGTNGSKVRMKPKFHNIRDKKGRFTSRTNKSQKI